MRRQHFFLLTAVYYIAYGFILLFMPNFVLPAEDEMGLGSTSIQVAQLLGGMMIATGAMAFFVKEAHLSIGRRAVLIQLVVASAFLVLLDAKSLLMMQGGSGIMGWLDLSIPLALLGGSVYYLAKEKFE